MKMDEIVEKQSTFSPGATTGSFMLKRKNSAVMNDERNMITVKR